MVLAEKNKVDTFAEIPDKVCGVYFLNSPQYPKNVVKIGYSANVRSRVNEFQVGSPERVDCVCVLVPYFPDSERCIEPKEIEKKIHEHLGIEKKIRGEWYEIDFNLLHWIFKELQEWNYDVAWAMPEWEWEVLHTTVKHAEIFEEGCRYLLAELGWDSRFECSTPDDEYFAENIDFLGTSSLSRGVKRMLNGEFEKW